MKWKEGNSESTHILHGCGIAFCQMDICTSGRCATVIDVFRCWFAYVIENREWKKRHTHTLACDDPFFWKGSPWTLYKKKRRYTQAYTHQSDHTIAKRNHAITQKWTKSQRMRKKYWRAHTPNEISTHCWDWPFFSSASLLRSAVPRRWLFKISVWIDIDADVLQMMK